MESEISRVLLNIRLVRQKLIFVERIEPEISSEDFRQCSPSGRNILSLPNQEVDVWYTISTIPRIVVWAL